MRSTVLILVTLFGMTAEAQDQKPQVPQISVTGEGKIKVTPDQAIVSVGFHNSGKDAKEVKTRNDEVVDKVIKFLKKSGIPATDYKTNNVSLNKFYDYDKKKYDFQADQTLSIMLKDLSKYDEIMMGLNDAGVNTINGVEFKSSKMDDYEREARKKAMVNAKQKAADYVSVLGGQKVGKALLITDNSQSYTPQPMFKGVYAMAADVAGAPRETLAVGEIEVNVNVSVTFSLE